MKIFKSVLIIFLTIVVLTVVGLGIFLKTFDLNKYVPQITEQARKALGREINISRAELGFSWAQGIVLNVRDVVVADDPRFSDKPFFSVDHINIGIDLGALVFRQKIQLVQVIVRSPRIMIIRSRDGLINATTIAAPKAAESMAGDQHAQKAVAAVPVLLVNDIKVMDAKVSYIDESFSPSITVMVDKIDINVHDLSLTDSFDLELKAALFSSAQNILAHARVRLDLKDASAKVEPFTLSADLSKIDPKRFENELPMVAQLGLKQAAGMITVNVPEFMAGAQGVQKLKAQVLWDKGVLDSKLLPAGLSNIAMKVDITEKQMDVKAFSFNMAGGAISGHALVVDYFAVPVLNVGFDLQGIGLKDLLAGYNFPVHVSGSLMGAGDLRFSGKTPDDVLATLNGNVNVAIKEGLLENVNLLALGLGNIPMLPGLLDSVMAALPPETQEEVKQGITRIQTCAGKARLMDGRIQIDQADLLTRDILAQAEGTIDLKELMDLKVEIRMAQGLSDRLADSVKELSVLKDDQGRIYIPMNIGGPVTSPKILPDIEYLTKKMIIASGGEKLQKVLGPEASQAVDAIFGLFKKK